MLIPLISDILVVRVENIVVIRVKVFVAGNKFPEDKNLKKPGGMGKVPFRRADIRYGLGYVVFLFKGSTEVLTLLPCLFEVRFQRLTIHSSNNL